MFVNSVVVNLFILCIMLLILWLSICWRCYFVVGLFIVGGAHFVVVALVYFGLCFAWRCVEVLDGLVVYDCFCLGCLWLGAYGLLLLVCVRLCSRCLFVDCGFCLVVCGLQVVCTGRWVLVVGVWLRNLCLVVGLVGVWLLMWWLVFGN